MATRAVEKNFSYVIRGERKATDQNIFCEKQSEYELQNLWCEIIKGKKEWTTVEGHSIKILTAGYENPYSGPDFKDALIEINGVPFRGDIEIHRSTREWFQHGHHRDARYNRVLLHVVSLVDKQVPCAINSVGNTIPTLQVHRKDFGKEPPFDGITFVSHDPGEIFPCFSHIHFDYELIVRILSQQRVMQRIRQMRMRHREVSLEQVLYEFLFYGLGAGSKYATLYRDLARRFPYSQIKLWLREDARIPEALFLACSGYLQRGISLRNPYALILEQIISSNDLKEAVREREVKVEDATSPVSCVFPLAFPPVKIAWMVSLLSKITDSLLDTFLSIAEKSLQTSTPWKIWESFLSVQHFYWSYYSGWTMNRTRVPKKLLGKERIYSLLGNILIPFFIFCAQEGLWGVREEKMWNFYFLLPGENTHWILKRMKPHIELLFPYRSLKFYEQQALVQWYKDGCAVHPQCIDCPWNRNNLTCGKLSN